MSWIHSELSVPDAARLALRIGVDNAYRYFLHKVKLKAGWYEYRQPTATWGNFPSALYDGAATPWEIYPEPSRIPAEAVTSADRVVGDELSYFSYRWLPRPSDWKTHPLTTVPGALTHWSHVKDFDLTRGDIKWIWEPSRFDWVYQLGRAFVRTGDETYRAKFWELLRSWREDNPPRTGINWKCGQECSLRLLALAWASKIFLDDTSTEIDRKTLWETIGRLAERIELAIDYAISQRNNHGLSEALGIFVAGNALPSHPRAKRWRRDGYRLFRRQFFKQFFPDGGYIQHSLNYERLALTLSLIFVRTCERNGLDVPRGMQERLLTSAELLYQLQDDTDGRLPNYGANDGARLMALHEGDPADFRAVLGAIYFWASEGKRLYAPGPHDEFLVWNFGARAIEAPLAPPPKRNLAAPKSGYFTLRDPEGFAFLRCHDYRTAPGHADNLHFDLWRRGKNLALDGGTYLYLDEKGWGHHFKSTKAHNTVTVDGQSQIRSGSRFQWLDWPKAECLNFGHSRGISYWQGEHYGYGTPREGIVHRRTVLQRETNWLVVDDLLFNESREAELALHWHLAEDAPDIFVFCRRPLREKKAQGPENFPLSGHSRSYGKLEPAKALTFCADSNESLRFLTAFGDKPQLTGDKVVWCGEVISLDCSRDFPLPMR